MNMRKIKVTHLGVYCLIKNDRDQFLLIKKSRGPYKGKLDLPGGKIEYGERIFEALKREVVEETGIELKDATLLDNLVYNIDFIDERGAVSMHHVGLVYYSLVKETSGLISEMDLEDSLGAIWIDKNQMDEKQLSPFAKIAVKKAEK